MSARSVLAARLVIGISVLVVLFVGLDPMQIQARLAHADLVLAAGGVAGLVAVHLIGAATWRLLVKQLSDVALPWRSAVSVYYIGQALGGVTPANLGGDAYRIHALGLRNTRLSVWPVLVQRATSYAGLALIAACCVVSLSAAFGWASELVIGALFLGVAIAALPIVFVKVAGLRHSLATVPRRTLMSSLSVGLVLGVVLNLVSIALTYVLVIAVTNGPVPLSAALAVAVARLAIAFPLTPSGLGVQEGALSLAFGALGLDPATAVAALLLSRCALLITGAIGIGFFLARRQSSDAVTVPAATAALVGNSR